MPHLGEAYSSSADIGRTIFTVSLIHKLLCHFGRYLQNSHFSFWTVITCWMLDSIITLQGFMIVDRSALYGSRNMLDQHRDMRLDIDNMSYEVIYWVLVSSTTLFLLLLCFSPPEILCCTGTSCTWGKDWECEHGSLWRFNIQVCDRNNLLFIRSNSRGRNLCDLPGKILFLFFGLHKGRTLPPAVFESEHTPWGEALAKWPRGRGQVGYLKKKKKKIWNRKISTSV